MTPEQWARVTAIFGQASEVPEVDRAELVTQLCQDDEDVRSEVLALLDADQDDGFLEAGARVQPGDLLDAAGGLTLAAGDVLGHYRIERLLARGGMGVLYVATDLRLDRNVTLKVLPAATARDPRARVRLQREARTAALLRHPHVVSVHALEEIGDRLVIVAEYVEGSTLAEWIAEHGPMPRDAWRRMARQLADALAAAHDAQVVHRDVKASNVVLGADGVRLMDFGIALGQARGGDTRMTNRGQSAGTPLAQAPEQLEGGPASALSDQFAYGLVLYEAASGRLPYGDGALAAVWARVLRDEPTPLSATAPQLEAADVAIVHRCLARRPEDRFASMHDVIAAFDGGPAGAAALDAPRRRSSWWEVHHAATTALYLTLLWPGWLVVDALPGRWRATVHLALVCVATLATSLRLHLWFGQRQYPAHVAETSRRWWPVLLAVDTGYATAVGGLALYAADTRLPAAVAAAGLAVGLAVASLVIEPATRRADNDA